MKLSNISSEIFITLRCSGRNWQLRWLLTHEVVHCQHEGGPVVERGGLTDLAIGLPDARMPTPAIVHRLGAVLSRPILFSGSLLRPQEGGIVNALHSMLN